MSWEWTNLVFAEAPPVPENPEDSAVMIAMQNPGGVPLQNHWGMNPGGNATLPSLYLPKEVRAAANVNMNAVKEKPEGLKRDFRGIPIMLPDQGGLETVEPLSSQIGIFRSLII